LFRHEAEFDGGECNEAAAEQRRADHEDDRQRNLGHDERVASPRAPRPERRPFPTLAQPFGELNA
jgi:hypothetical protein